MTTIDTDDQNRGLYRKYELRRVNEDGSLRYVVADPFFALRYTTDPHARVALEAYADSCAADHPALAADLHRQLGIDADPEPLELLTPELAARLERSYQGKWVAIRAGDVVARADDLQALRSALDEHGPDEAVTVFRVPVEGEQKLT